MTQYLNKTGIDKRTVFSIMPGNQSFMTGFKQSNSVLNSPRDDSHLGLIKEWLN